MLALKSSVFKALNL